MYDNINTYYKDTNIFINELSAKTVLKLLKREEESHPLSAEKYAYMSKAYVFIQDDIMAQKYARKAIRADRNYPYGYIRLAFSYARMGKKRQTLKFTRIADSFDLSNNSFLLSFIAALYLYCEEESLAENVLDKLQKIPTKGADYYFNFGFLYGRENPEKALKYFKKALELNYKDTYKLWSWLADSYKDIEDYKNAELYADKCLLCGESYDTLDIKAECLNKNGYELEAVKYLNYLVQEP